MPQPGPQTEAFTCPADELMAGGERGGGKSHLIMGREITGSQNHNLDWNGIIFRRKYKDFKEFRIAFDKEIAKGLPAKRIGGENQINFIKYDWGGTTTLAQAGSLEAVRDWIGHQFTHVSIDEAQTFPYLTAMMSTLKGSMRSAAGIEPRMLLTGNPGGPGASQIKNMFIPLNYGGDVDIDEGRVNMVDIEQDDGSVAKISRVFIQLPLKQNKILIDGDPKYINRLQSIQDPNLRAAWLDGRWDVFVGQAFNFSKKNILTHPIWPIPSYTPVYMSFDWGWGAPFHVGWYWADSDGRFFMFAEWYGSKKNLPNVGLQMVDAEIAEGILEREKKWGISGRIKLRVAGEDCFRKKPNYQGGGQGPATSDEFVAYCQREDVRGRYGNPDLTLHPGDDRRDTKIRQFRNRLASPRPDELPMFMVYPSCKASIRTIPALVVDEVNPEEIEDHQEDHCFDSAGRLLNMFPIHDTGDFSRELQEEERKQKRMTLNEESRAAMDEWQQVKEELEEQDDEWIWQ